jgi:hypothetical protein
MGTEEPGDSYNKLGQSEQSLSQGLGNLHTHLQLNRRLREKNAQSEYFL